MRELDKTLKEILIITEELIRCGLSMEFNYPKECGGDIVWGKYKNISRYLKKLEYASIYEEIKRDQNYNFMLPDGGIVQMMYRFDSSGKELLSHRLAFYPSPSFELYQNDSDLYDEDCIYGDILNKDVLPVVIRVDYNKDNSDSEIHHPHVHITLGGYKNCRIPADRPVSPMCFIKFIMEHFYYVPSAAKNFNFSLRGFIDFKEHIAECDRRKSRMVI